ncbi:hypothetical protein B0I31_112138 [Saccharothrix carnea]|uniref:Uncharacterized protein n=1 Tax=Saccharothrix carnea TaxID=1280637 RepID=A0A2P8I2I2_SACCR|nr:hypothetical protein [Saccharothrix carnea]PSL52669.1 hypothetical protein B0I31_112138 [Saccharothrix carnea]
MLPWEWAAPSGSGGRGAESGRFRLIQAALGAPPGTRADQTAAAGLPLHTWRLARGLRDFPHRQGHWHHMGPHTGRP